MAQKRQKKRCTPASQVASAPWEEKEGIAKEREGQLIGKISAVIFLALPLSVLFFPLPVAASKKVVAQEEDVNLSRELQVAVEEGGKGMTNRSRGKQRLPRSFGLLHLCPRDSDKKGKKSEKKERSREYPPLAFCSFPRES